MTEPPRTMRIEMDRGTGWELRSEGTVSAPADQVAAQINAYAYSQYPHRILLDGTVVAAHNPRHRP